MSRTYDETLVPIQGGTFPLPPKDEPSGVFHQQSSPPETRGNTQLAYVDEYVYVKETPTLGIPQAVTSLRLFCVF